MISTPREKALERLAFLRRHLPSHGTHGEEMFNAFHTVEAALKDLSEKVESRGHASVIYKQCAKHLGQDWPMLYREIPYAEPMIWCPNCQAEK